MTTHRRAFRGVPEVLGAARAWLRRLLDGHPCADDAKLIVSELAANAIRHTASGDQTGTFHVALPSPTTKAVRAPCGFSAPGPTASTVVDSPSPLRLPTVSRSVAITTAGR
ncbi:ATP-binding protein [Streptacidiphilus sp. EB129]|uniref:ATP-binding protein n=1 Tax=Streptacidiphilus sp. EB129 TaxID=3156262 RepID=UPI00351359D8